MPRIEDVVDPEDTTCACGTKRHIIGEDTSERLDIIPAQFRVMVTRRPKYACRSCKDGIVQAAAKARLIEGGLPTEATVAFVIVSKYADHLPLYRIEKQIRELSAEEQPCCAQTKDNAKDCGLQDLVESGQIAGLNQISNR